MTIPPTRAQNTLAEKPKPKGAQPAKKSRLALLSLTARGVVFGDISTSLIYAIRECFHGEHGIEASPARHNRHP